MSDKILHLVHNEKFIAPFIDFVKDNNIKGKHTFLYFGGEPEEIYPIPDEENIVIIYNEYNLLKKIVYLIRYLFITDKIILHGLFNISVVKFLYYQPWLLKKCHWVMWGGDLYYHILAKDDENYENIEKYRKKVIKGMGHLVTYIKGDYELAQKWYGAKGEYHECFMYPSNLYKEYNIKPKEQNTTNIQVGNSADPTNNHLEVFEKLEKYKDEDIRVIVPLSQGDKEYAQEVIKKGKSIFDAKFEVLTDFIPFDEYLDLLAEVDIAIFNHNRQQAMGNTITLLGLGKKVYMRTSVTPWNTFQNIGIKIFDVKNVILDLLDEEIKQQNQKRVKEYFSKENYLIQLNKLFES